MIRHTIDGVSGWELLTPLMSKIPRPIMNEVWKCESPIEQMLTTAFGAVIGTIPEKDRPTVTTQVPIGRYRADIVIIAPLGAPRIVVECDGLGFHTDKAKDVRRTAVIENEGYRVFRLTGSEIYNNPLVRAKAILKSAGFLT